MCDEQRFFARLGISLMSFSSIPYLAVSEKLNYFCCFAGSEQIIYKISLFKFNIFYEFERTLYLNRKNQISK